MGKRKKTFHQLHVPHYMPTNTPTIPLSPKAKEMSEADLESSKRRMSARTFVRTWIKDNWTDGDRFQVESGNQGHTFSLSRHAGRGGVFHNLYLQGSVWFVNVTFDDPERKTKGTGHGGGMCINNTFGMFDFYHNATKCDPSVRAPVTKGN